MRHPHTPNPQRTNKSQHALTDAGRWDRLECERQRGLCSVFADSLPASSLSSRVNLTALNAGVRSLLNFQRESDPAKVTAFSAKVDARLRALMAEGEVMAVAKGGAQTVTAEEAQGAVALCLFGE
eukprot:916773-Rhodomonas_salina.1